MKRRVLISVTEKAGLIELARGLVARDYEIVSTGGTHDAIAAVGIPVIQVADVTGFPEMLDGRVKSMHPLILGGILADRGESTHMESLTEHNITPIDIVVCNLYKFADNPGIENIDIGGPTMIRSAAKNHGSVAVVVDPADYDAILDDIDANTAVSTEVRRHLARKAFAHTAAYDAMITTWLDEQMGNALPDTVHLTGTLVNACKYGENAHQAPAGFYSYGTPDPLGLDKIEFIAGSQPSFNNYIDADRAQRTLTAAVAAYDRAGLDVPYIAVAVKHGNACGAGIGQTSEEATDKTARGDKRALFGGLFIANFEIGHAEAVAIKAQQPTLDAVLAPSITEQAIGVLRRASDKTRFIVNPALSELMARSRDRSIHHRQIRGGFLVQPSSSFVLDLADPSLKVYGDEPTVSEVEDLLLGFAVCSTSNSNTITLVKNGMVIGNGVGQQDRVSCCELAIKRAIDAGHDISGAVAVSDSFFPFDDGPKTLITAGVGVIFSTSGSVRDADTQAACEQAGITLIQQPDTEARMFAAH